MTAKAILNIVVDDLTDQILREERRARELKEEDKLGEAFRHECRIEALEAAITQVRSRRAEVSNEEGQS